MQDFTSNIRFTCPSCNFRNERDVSVPELNFMAEKMSDMSVDDIVEVECEGCETVFSGSVYVDAHSTHFQIEEPVSFEFSGDMPMYQPEEEFDIPGDPYTIAKEALGALQSMIGKMTVPIGDPQFANRLIFSGAIAALEAYLSDTLIGAIRRNEEVFKSVATKNERLKDMRLTVAQLVSQPDLLKTMVQQSLSDVIYHNLKIVTAIYRDAFDFEILPDKTQRTEIFQAINYRHDCIHRNGCNKDGVRLEIFDDKYVNKIIDTVCKINDYIEIEVNKIIYNTDDLEFFL